MKIITRIINSLLVKWLIPIILCEYLLVAISKYIKPINSYIQENPFMGLFANTGVTTLFAVLMYLLVFKRPLDGLIFQIKKLEVGELKQKIDDSSKDEFSMIANSINLMSEKLSKYYVELEEEVKKRTEEISIQNEKLTMLNNYGQLRNKEFCEANLKLARKSYELSILYELSSSISYVLDCEDLIRIMMETLYKVVDYDLCGYIIIGDYDSNITIKPIYLECFQLIEKVKESLLHTSSMLLGEKIRTQEIKTKFLEPQLGACPNENRKFSEIISFFTVPFIVHGKEIGMMGVYSCNENGFGSDTIKLLYTIGNQVAIAIEKVRTMIEAEKTKMATIAESMNEGIIMFDEKQDVAIINPSARSMFDFRYEDSVTKSILLERMRSIGIYDIFCESEINDVRRSKEVYLHKKNKILLNEIFPVKDANNKKIGTVIQTRNVTKEREMENTKMEFVSIISHEMRTPLSIMRESISLLRDKVLGSLNDKQADALIIAMSNVDRLTGIIENLLDISRLEASKIELNREMVCINYVIKDVFTSLELKAKEKNIQLLFDNPDEEVEIYVDRDRMAQVFINLISNGIKFTDSGYVGANVEKRDFDFVFRISDSGRGIGKTDLPKVFGKFEQFDRPAGAGEKGTGLGLSIVKRIIDLHNGTIGVDSELSKGTTFTLSLPKYSTKLIIKEYINRAIKKSLRESTKFSLVVLSIFESDTVSYQLPAISSQQSAYLKEKLPIIKEIRNLIKAKLRSKKDLLIEEENEIIIFLDNCNKDGATHIEGRLLNILPEYLNKLELKIPNLALNFGRATFPDETTDPDDLIKIAKESMKCIMTANS